MEDGRYLLEYMAEHQITKSTFKGQGRKQLLKALDAMRETYLIAGEPKEGKQVLLFAIPRNGSGFTLLMDAGRDKKEDFRQMELESLLPLADVLAPFIFRYQSRYKIKQEIDSDTRQEGGTTGRGGRRKGAGRPLTYTEEQAEQVRSMRRAGATLRTISSATGISLGTIQRILYQN